MRVARFPVLLASFLLLVGCRGRSENEVVVYTALDAEFSEEILASYGQRRQVDVRPVFDVESTKTVGLVTRIIHEQDRPRCDLFWNNEILHTLRLQKMGLLETYASPAGGQLPEDYRAADGSWYGFAARARVLLVNTDLVGDDQMPEGILDLVRPEWKDRVGIAKPLFGTTATHAAVLFTKWGPERAQQFFRQVQANVQVLSGNKQVALAVGRGELAFGLTDTDDAIIEVENGQPVRIVYPDQQEGGMGTLFIPNTVCLIKGSPNSQEARRLLDHLLSPEIEALLAEGRSAQFPVNPEVGVRSRAAPSEPTRWMEVDFGAAADQWPEAAAFLRDLFAAAQ
jgi:iron(III) transport system substrate-binding protein